MWHGNIRRHHGRLAAVKLARIVLHAGKKPSIDSTPTRAGIPPLAGARFKILADLRFKLAFELFIGFKLHTFHTSKIVPMMLSVSV
jgi:hypothetical protein